MVKPSLAATTRVVLFDLDHTIMDSTAARSAAWDNALHELRDTVAPEKTKPAMQAIYRLHDSIEGQKGPRGHKFVDTRQVWNSRDSYAILLAWQEDRRFEKISQDTFEDELRRILENPEDKAHLLRRAEELHDRWSLDYQQEIDRAMAAFWKGSYRDYIYRGVEDLLKTLHRRKISYYIATEGHLPTQWQKLQWLKLASHSKASADDWRIRPEQLLSTSQAAAPHHGASAIRSLAEWYSGHAAATRRAAKSLKAPCCHHQCSGSESRCPISLDLEQSSNVAERIASGLTKMLLLFKRLERKTPDAAFYSRVLYAINQNPIRPSDRLASINFNWKSGMPFRLAVVGDRFNGDVEPIVQLGKKAGVDILSIWISGQGPHNTQDQPPSGDILLTVKQCKTIQDAGKILLDDSSWLSSTTPFTEQPPLFIGALEPKPSETWPRNILDFLAALGAVFGVSQPQEGAIESIDASVPVIAREAVTQLLRLIIPDIRLSPRARETIQELLALVPSDPGNVILPLLRSPGMPTTVVRLLFDLVGDQEHLLTPSLAHLVNVLSPNVADWAAALIIVLGERNWIVGHVRRDETLRTAYSGRLTSLLAAPPSGGDFPANAAEDLLVELRRELPSMERVCRGEAQNATSRELPAAVFLGMRSYESPETQSWVEVGSDPSHRQLRVLLGGEKARNIVCICGATGGGKSQLLKP